MIRIAICLGALLPQLTPAGESTLSTQQPQSVELKYLPTAGERLEHNWLGTHKLLATEVTSRMEGQEPQSLPRLPSIETKERRVTADWVRSVEDGVIQDMHRTWIDVSLWGKLDFHNPGQKPLEVLLKSPLGNETTSVVYTYVPEDKEYGMYFDQSAMPEKVLSGVRMDHDYQNLLPGKTVQVGDTWKVKPTVLLELLAPTGAMSFSQTEPGGAMLIRTLLMGVGGCTEMVWNPEVLTGSLDCTLEKIVGAGNLSMAHIQLNYEFATSQDRTSAARSLAMLGESNRGTVVLANAVQLSGKGRGVLIWNLALNRAHSFAMAGNESVQLQVQTQALNSPAVTQVMKLNGVCEQKYRANVLPVDMAITDWTLNPPVRKASEPKLPTTR